MNEALRVANHLVVPACSQYVAAQNVMSFLRGRHLAVLLLGLSCFSLTGCSALDRRNANRSQKCGELCKKAVEVNEQGWPDQAELLLNEAIRQHPRDAETRAVLAETMWSTGRRDAALEEFRSLVSQFPNDRALAVRLAEMEWDMGNTAVASNAAEAALQIDPNSIEALLVKARSDTKRGDYENALAAYIRVTQMAPCRNDLKTELAELHLRRGNPDQACPMLRDVMQSSQASPQEKIEAEWKLGLAYAAEERWTDAASYLSHAIEQRESSENDWRCLTAVMTLAGQDVEGVKAMARLASVRQFKEEPGGVWTSLRDQVVQRSEGNAALSGELFGKSSSLHGIVRADFNRPAQSRTPSYQSEKGRTTSSTENGSQSLANGKSPSRVASRSGQ